MECQICKNAYNNKNYIPRILNKCGHTYCEVCIFRICTNSDKKNIESRYEIVCPVCNLITNIDDILLLTKNLALIDNSFEKKCSNNSLKESSPKINKTKNKFVCSIHSKDLEAYCETDNIMLCVSCIIENDHKNHDLSSIDKAAQIERDSFEIEFAKVLNIENYLNDCLRQTETNKNNIKNNFEKHNLEVCKFFKKIKELIEMCEEEYYESSKIKFEKELEDLNSVDLDIERKMEVIKNVKKYKNEFDCLTEFEILSRSKEKSNLIKNIYSEIPNIKENEFLEFRSNEEYFKILKRLNKLFPSDVVTINRQISNIENKIELIENIHENIKFNKNSSQNNLKTSIKPGLRTNSHSKYLKTKPDPVIINNNPKNTSFSKVPLNNEKETYNYVKYSNSHIKKSARNRALFPQFTIKSSKQEIIHNNPNEDYDNQSANFNYNIGLELICNNKEESGIYSNVELLDIVNQVPIDGQLEPIDNSTDPLESMDSSVSSFQLMNSFQMDVASLYKATSSYILILGGKSDVVTRKYTIDTYTWANLHSEKGPLNIERSDFSAVMYKDKKILIMGGKITNHNGNEMITDTIELMNTMDNSIRKLDIKMKHPRVNFGVIYAKSKLYVAGGFNGRDVLNNIEFFDQKNKIFIDLPKMFYKRREFAFVYGLDNYIYSIGGADDKEYFNNLNFLIYRVVLKTVEKFDLDKCIWSRVDDMNQKRKACSAICMPDGIYVLGGYDGCQYLKSVEKYDFQSKKWKFVQDMQHARCHFSVCVSNDLQYIYCVGGYNGKPLAYIERFDTISGKWELVDKMPFPKYRHQSFYLTEFLYA